MRLHLRADDDALPARVVPSARPLLIGRDPNCDVALDSADVSRHHALLWVREGVLFVRDLGSRRGTRVGRRHLAPGEACAARAGDEVVLGRSVRFVASGPPRSVLGPPMRALRGAPPSDGALHLEISVLDGRPVAAHAEDDGGGAERTLRGESQVVLLYLLAKRHRAFLSCRAPDPWVCDEDLGVGLWGGRGRSLPTTRLNTVIARVRRALEPLSGEAPVIEKARGRTRLGPAWEDVELAEIDEPTCIGRL